MNKTIYIRDEDIKVWDRAKELAGDKLAPVIMERLKTFVIEKEAEARGFNRIEIDFNDAKEHGLPKRKAFYGRWIYSPETPFLTVTETFQLAVTAKNSVVVLYSNKLLHSQDSYFKVFPSFEAAARDPFVKEAAKQAVIKIGVPIEELDI